MTTHDNPNGPCSCGAWHKPDAPAQTTIYGQCPIRHPDCPCTTQTSLAAPGPLLEIGIAAKLLAYEKGFGSEDSQAMSVMRIALMHQELSEMLEAVRMPGEPMSKKVPSITLEAEELADLFLRLAQYAAIRGIDIDRAVSLKHEYNKSRPFKHGKKF